MSRRNDESYDVIVIGAGISGLICGCFLARAGLKVLILEQHDKPGGYCSSFKRRDVLFDAAAHSFGSYRENGNFRKISVELGLDKLLNIKRFDPSDAVVTPDFTLSFFNDIPKTISHLSNIFPNEADNIERYYDFIMKLDQVGAARLKDKTFGDLLGTFFKDNRLINALSVPIFGNGGLPPSLLHAFTGSKIFAEFLIDGGYYPNDSMQSLPNALESIVKRHKGTILYKRLVSEILLDDNAVSGVKLDNDESYFCRYVVSACDITQLYKAFLGEHVVGKPLIDKMQAMTPSLSTFILYMGIDKPFAGLPREGTNIWYLPYYDLDKMYERSKLCDLDNVGGFMTRVSPDKKSVIAFFPAPFKTKEFWRQHKKAVSQNFVNKVEKLMPGLKDHVTFLDAATPYTLYRYTLNHQGANYGWAPLKQQLFDADFRQKSFIRGLYVTGHWTAQTHGIQGVAFLGYNTAKLLLRREKINI